MRRLPNFYKLTPDDRRTQRLWAMRVAVLYGIIVLVAFVALAVGAHQSPTNQVAGGAPTVASATGTKTSAVRPR